MLIFFIKVRSVLIPLVLIVCRRVRAFELFTWIILQRVTLHIVFHCTYTSLVDIVGNIASHLLNSQTFYELCSELDIAVDMVRRLAMAL